MVHLLASNFQYRIMNHNHVKQHKLKTKMAPLVLWAHVHAAQYTRHQPSDPTANRWRLNQSTLGVERRAHSALDPLAPAACGPIAELQQRSARGLHAGLSDSTDWKRRSMPADSMLTSVSTTRSFDWSSLDLTPIMVGMRLPRYVVFSPYNRFIAKTVGFIILAYALRNCISASVIWSCFSAFWHSFTFSRPIVSTRWTA